MSKIFTEATDLNTTLTRRYIPSPHFKDSWDAVYELHTKDVTIQITMEQAHLILTRTLPPEKLVWSVNPAKGGSFYSPEYPEWSVKPHPAHLVAGNIYYSTEKQADVALINQLHGKIATIRDRANRETGDLINVINKLTNAST